MGTRRAHTRNRAPSPDRHKTWKDYGGGPDSSKFLALDQITKSNVSRLQVAWTYPTGDNSVYGFNPIIVDDVMYVLARNSSLVALNAVTGKEIWIHENLRGIARRGVNYWESKDRSERRILFQMNNYLQAIDARTGKSILGFGKNGLVDLREGLGRETDDVARAQSNTPGKIFDNLILLGVAPGEAYMSTPGYLRAYDVRDRRARVDVPHGAACPANTATTPGRKTPTNTSAAPTRGARSRSTSSAASRSSRPDRPPTTTTAPIGSEVTCSATACSRSTRGRASACGTSRSCTTICGTTISPPRRS